MLMRRFILALSLAFLMLIDARSALSAEVSARRALEATLPDVRFDNISVDDALNFLRDVSGANIHVNWRAMEAAGITRDTTINLRLRSVSLRKILGLVLSEAAHGNLLSYYIDENVIEVTTRELADQTMILRIYPVDDLIMEVPDFDQPPNFQIQGTQAGRGSGGGGGNLFAGQPNGNNGRNLTRNDRAQQLIDTIQAIVQPEIWSANGGPAAIRFWNGSLIVTAPRSVHEALGGFVD
jgi:hypothetical protein